MENNNNVNVKDINDQVLTLKVIKEGLELHNLALKQIGFDLENHNTKLSEIGSELDVHNKGLKEIGSGLQGHNHGLRSIGEGLKYHNEGLKTIGQGLKDYNSGLSKISEGLEAYNTSLEQIGIGLTKHNENLYTSAQNLTNDNENLQAQKEELSKSSSSLGNLLETKAKEISELIEKLENTNLLLLDAKQHKKRFLSSVNHELRTPLNAIIGFNNLLQDAHYGELNPKQKEYVHLINYSSNYLLTLLSDILDLSYIDSGSLELINDVFMLDEIIKEVKSLMEIQFKDKNINLEFKPLSNPSYVYADKRKCRQIIYNLLNNSLKYTNTNGNVEIYLEKVNDTQIKVLIKDDGMGIEQEHQDKIFEEFYNPKEKLSGDQCATGVGLALCKKLVEIQGGEIGVVSEINEGSCFWFTLPLKDIKDYNNKSVPEIVKASIKGTYKILVVEDNYINQKLIFEVLSLYKQEVILANNKQNVVELIIKHQPQLILIDISLPLLCGLNTMKAIKDLPELNEIPILALIGFMTADEKARLKNEGFTEVLEKPDRMFQLIESISKFLT